MSVEAQVEAPQEAEFSEEEIAADYDELHFYIRRSRIYLIAIGGVSLYIMACLLLLSGYVTQPPPPITFISDKEGTTERITASLNPKINDHQAVRWANDAATELLSIHFRNYAEQIAQRRTLFAGDGWTLYQQSLLDSGTIEKIKDSGLIITAVNADTPRLLNRYVLDGKTNWYLQIPVLQTIQGAKEKGATERKLVDITVQEARRDEALEGLQIRLFNISR